MYDETLQPGSTEPSRPLASKFSATEPHWLLQDALRSSQRTFEDYTLIVAPLGLIAIWAIALACFRQQQKRRENAELSSHTHHRQPQKIPCRHCVFFKDNPYLKCAINPTEALTQRAIDCTDYAPHTPPLNAKRRE